MHARFPAPVENVVPRADHLTGLANRKAWFEAVDREEARCKRRNDDASIILVQIDHLAQINSIRGERAGDATLRRTAKVVGSLARGEDTVARIAGDTFGLLATDCNALHAQVIVQRLTSGLALSSIDATLAHGTRGPKDDLAAVVLAIDAELYSIRQGRLAQAGLRRTKARSQAS